MIVPIASLLACVCGVLLILGFIARGPLASLPVLIPCIVLGGLSVICIFAATIASYRYTRSSPPADSVRPRRRDNLSIRRRMEIVGRLPHVVDLEEKACSICLAESPPERVVLSCGHVYHETCVTEWMRRARFARCPLCRTRLDITPVTSADENPPTYETTASATVNSSIIPTLIQEDRNPSGDEIV